MRLSRSFLPALAWGLVLSFACARAPALAADAKDARNLLLEMWLDGRNMDRIAAVTWNDGHILVKADDLAALKLNLKLPAPDAKGELDVTDLPQLQASVDDINQRLNLSLPTHALPAQLYDLSRPSGANAAGEGMTGAILRYDLSTSVNDATRWGRTVQGGANARLDIFTPGVQLRATGFASGGVFGWRVARLDTAAIFDDPETLRHISIGDAITAAPAFARSVRFGGLSIARDYSLRPDMDTRPLPQFFGQTAVPLTVDVFSGAAQVFQQKVQPGPFTLNNLPIVSGGGTATIVTRDVLGRQTTQVLSLYTSNELLAPGLSSYALDLGFLRTAYGVRDSYSKPILSASVRRGFAGPFTLQAHMEGAPHQAMVSGGAALPLGGFGSLSGDIALSSGRRGSGAQYALNAQARAGFLSVYASGAAASAGFADLASLENPGGAALPRLRYQLGVAAGLGQAGSLSTSFISSQYRGAAASQFLSASWTLGLPRSAFLSLSALHDMGKHATSAQLSLAMPLGERGLVSLTGTAQGSGVSGQGIYDHPGDPDGGFGYRLLTGWQDGGRFEGDATYVGPHLGADGAVAVQGGIPALRGDVSGALVMMHDKLYAVHEPGEAVALVETGDPHVRVYRENRQVAVSDDNGQALVTGLNPYAPNHIALDPRDYAFDTLIEQTEKIVVPRRASAVMVNFKPASRRPLVALATRGPLDVPLGAKVTLDGTEELHTVGHGGEIFIADLDHAVGADVELNGTRCRLYIRPSDKKGMMPRTEPLLCLREADGAY